MEKLNKKAYYHLPGLFEFYELYCVFLPLYRKHREFSFVFKFIWIYKKVFKNEVLDEINNRITNEEDLYNYISY